MSSRHMSRVRRWLLSSPPVEWAVNQLRELMINALRQGPIPKHIAFVMDGNRRFARSRRIETVEGHHLGFEALARILEVCYKSGVTHVTIYAFSIENFKRSKYEVDGLMDMASVKLQQMVQHGDIADRYGAKIRILGQRELIRQDLLEIMDRAVEMTAKNNKAVLNICFPYTSREEITTAIRTTVEDWNVPLNQPSGDNQRRDPFREERIANIIRTQELADHTKISAVSASKHLHPPDLHSPSSSVTSLVSTTSDSAASHSPTDLSISSSSTLQGLDSPFLIPTKTASPLNQLSSTPIYPSPELITPETLTAHMLNAGDPPLDLLIRTSGVRRLSDFMLWQCHEDTEIVFVGTLWPAFDLWQFLPVLWEWQWRVRKREKDERERRDALPSAATIFSDDVHTQVQ